MPKEKKDLNITSEDLDLEVTYNGDLKEGVILDQEVPLNDQKIDELAQQNVIRNWTKSVPVNEKTFK